MRGPFPSCVLLMPLVSLSSFTSTKADVSVNRCLMPLNGVRRWPLGKVTQIFRVKLLRLNSGDFPQRGRGAMQADVLLPRQNAAGERLATTRTVG